MITLLVDKVIERLRTEFDGRKSGVQISEPPFQEIGHGGGSAVLVRLNKITAAKQIKNYEIDISVLSKALSNEGVYGLTQFVLSALDGFKPAMIGVGEAEFEGAEFVKCEGGVWDYTIHYKFSISGR